MTPDILEDIPRDDLAEQAVLGGMMLSKTALNEVVDALTPEDFYHPKHEAVFRAIHALAMRSDPVDAISVSEELARAGALNDVLSSAYVHYLTGSTTTAANAGYHAHIIRGLSIRRKMIEAGHEIVRLGQAPEGDPVEQAEQARAIVDGALGMSTTKSSTSDEVVDEVIGSIGRTTTALPTPWRSLDYIIRGFRPGGMYVIGARPGIGKSAIALQIARELERFGHVGFFSLEMSQFEVTQRLVAQATQVPFSMIDGSVRMEGHAQWKIDEWRPTYSGKIIFNDAGTITAPEIRALVRTWARDKKLTGIVIDYLQLVSGPPNVKKLELVTEVSRQLKLLARDFNIPVIALSQLNRNAESRADGRPMLSDLRESGAIEQDADVVMLLHRSVDQENPRQSDLEIIVAKNRQGPQSSVMLNWHGEFMMAIE